MAVFDHWGFLIDPSVARRWRRLESYAELRQQRQMDRWDRVGGLEIVQQFNQAGTHAQLQRNSELFWHGVPEHLRKHVYMLVRGACVGFECERVRACVPPPVPIGT